MIHNKKKYGQYFTNEKIAKFMVNWVIKNKTKSFLDPAVGEGVFIKLAQQIDKTLNMTALDIDDYWCQYLQHYLKKDCIKNADYLNTELDKYDAIVCNPPYNKFQKIKNRKILINNFQEKYSIKLNGYSNLCIYFLIKSLNELNTNGRCAYIIPYEFLNTGYGEVIKRFFIESHMLHSIIKFDNSMKLFEDAITTSCILLFENKYNEKIHFINVSNINELDSTNSFIDEKIYTYDELNPNGKWLNYFKIKQLKVNNNLIKLKDIGQVKRGIATGNNSYFTLNTKKISDLKLSKDVCLPCITKSADITNLIFDIEEFEKLKRDNKKTYLFNGTNANCQNDYEYISYGENSGYDKTYLTSHRKPWYSIENKMPAPILLSVFCRNKLKVIRNTSNVRNLTTFHGFYFNKLEKENFINLFFCYLLTPTAQKILFNNKREYGDGLDKFEPNDLNNAYVLNINLISENDRNKILNLYEDLKKSNRNKCIEEMDNIFSSYTEAS